MKKDYSNGIEVVVVPFIVRKDGKILLIKSKKWKDIYLMPGGHVEKGEKLAEAVLREGKEETALNLKVLDCIKAGELICDPSFHRKAHLIYFYFLCKALNEKVQPDSSELSDYIWIEPQKALRLRLATGTKEAIKDYINKNNINIGSYKFN